MKTTTMIHTAFAAFSTLPMTSTLHARLRLNLLGLSLGLALTLSAQTADLIMVARDTEETILPQLNGVRLVADANRVPPADAPPPVGVSIDGIRGVTEADLAEVTEMFIGQPASRESLDRLRLLVRTVFMLQGRPFTDVYTPPQDITSGVVQFVVIESALGQVRVEGNQHFSAAELRSRLALPSDGQVDPELLRTSVDRINRNHFRQVATRVEAGAEPGTTDVVLQVNDRRPWRVFGGYNNAGTKTTTEDRLSGGVTWGDALGLGHVASVQWNSDLKAKHSRSVSANYAADLPGNLFLSAFGAYSEIESVPSGALSQEGMSWQAGLNLELPLRAPSARYTHHLQFGADFKVSDNNLEFALPPFVIPISDNLTHIAQARVSYRGTLTDDWGATSWGAQVVASPGGLSAENNDAAFSASRAMARADYVYGTLDLTRQTRLRGGLDGWTWTVRGQAQLSSGNLLGSEQFSGGGSGSVRGYEQGEVVGDNGLLLSQELAAPALRPLQRWFGGESAESLVPFIFQDAARLWNVDKLSGEKPFTLHSVGIGVRYQVTQHGSLQLAQGWQLRDSGSSDTGKNSRLHISANVSF